MNTAYAIKHAIARPTKFNIILVVALVVYCVSYIPLLMTSSLTIELSDQKETPQTQPLFAKLDILLRVYTALYGISTLMYILLVQIRFRVVKSLISYRSIYDHIFVAITVLVCLLSTFLFGVILPTSSVLASIAAAVWTLYGLLVDNILSFVFIKVLYTSRTTLSKSAPSSAWKRVVGALGFLCIVTWLCLALLLTGNIGFANDRIVRTVLFRIAYSFTPLEFSGALVFMYTVRSLVAPPSSPGSASPPMNISPPIPRRWDNKKPALSIVTGRPEFVPAPNAVVPLPVYDERSPILFPSPPQWSAPNYATDSPRVFRDVEAGRR